MTQTQRMTAKKNDVWTQSRTVNDVYTNCREKIKTLIHVKIKKTMKTANDVRTNEIK